MTCIRGWKNAFSLGCPYRVQVLYINFILHFLAFVSSFSTFNQAATSLEIKISPVSAYILFPFAVVFWSAFWVKVECFGEITFMIARFKSLYGDSIWSEPGLRRFDVSSGNVRHREILLEGKMLLPTSEKSLDSIVRMRCWTAFLSGRNNPVPLKPLSF